MSMSLTHLSWWLWSGKHQEPKRLSNGSSLNSSQDSGLWESDALKFPLVKGTSSLTFQLFFSPRTSWFSESQSLPISRTSIHADLRFLLFFFLRWIFNLGFWFCLFQFILRSSRSRFRIHPRFDILIVGLFGWSHGGDRWARAAVRVYVLGCGVVGGWRCGWEFEFQFFLQGFNFSSRCCSWKCRCW